MSCPSILYKYKRLDNFTLDYLTTDHLFFPCIFDLNDPFEADIRMISATNEEDKLIHHHNEFLQVITTQYEKYRALYAARRTDVFDSFIDSMDHSFSVISSWFRLYKGLYDSALKMQEKLKTASLEEKLALMHSFWYGMRLYVLEKIGIVSFTANPRSAVMWAHYADNHKGICIAYSTWRRPVTGWKNFKYHKVNYSNQRQVDFLQYDFQTNFERMLLQKSEEWKYEEEYRLISYKGRGIQQGTPGAINGIILGRRIAYNNEQTKMALFKALEMRLRKKTIAPWIYLAYKSDSDFNIEHKPLENLAAVEKALHL
jgi:hypothetical protein